MIKIGILGDIGSGKSFVAKNFGYPVFNADLEVGKLYKKNRKIFNKLRKKLPKYIYSFPINKDEICEAILENKTKLKVDTDKEHLVNVLKYGTDPLDLYNQYHIKSEEGNQLHLALMNFLHTDRGVSSNEALHISIFTCDMSPVKHHVSRLYDNDDLCLYCGRTKESDNYRSRNG